jgi:hypothetical protein
VQVLSESLTGASAVWNAMLGTWNQVKRQPRWDLSGEAATQVEASPAGSAIDEVRGAIHVDEADPRGAAAGASPSLQVTHDVLDPMRAKRALAGMLGLDGLLGCAIVDAGTGLVLARESRESREAAQPELPIDMDLAAAASAQILRAHRQAARAMGLPDSIEELMTSAGPRQQVIRAVARHPDLFLVALLEKHRTNLALARFQLMEVERALL